MARKKLLIKTSLLVILLVCISIILLNKITVTQNAYADRTTNLNVTDAMTGYNKDKYFVFNDSYSVRGDNNVKEFFTGTITQKRVNYFELKISCSDTKHISEWNNGDYYYSSSYKVSSSADDETALILVFGSNYRSDYKSLNQFPDESSQNLRGTAIKSSKTITRGGNATTTIRFSTDYRYIWYHVVYQWCAVASHSRSYLVSGQSDIFEVDKTAPTGTLSGVRNNGITNSDVKFTWSEDNCSATLDGVSYSSGNNISSEGTHTIKLTDAVGNASTYKFEIDKTIPQITSEISNNGKTNKLVAVTASDKHFQSLFYKSPGKSDWIETTSDKFSLTSDNGTWEFKAKDKAGNESSIYYIVYDDQSPNVTAPAENINSDFVFSANDPNGVTIEYWLEGKPKNIYKGNSVTINGISDNYGVWHFVASDDVGNKTQEYIIRLFIRDKFGNSENIKNSYKIPVYYSVRLVEKYFGSSAGTYSFASFEVALRFAIEKEWQHRIVTLDGNKWSYVNISNESVTQTYEDRASLDEAVEKYARNNISERQIFGVANSGNAYLNPTDEDFVTREDALTLQNLELPSHLSQYNGLPVYFISHNYSFIRPKDINGNTISANIKYISNGVSSVSRNPINITYSDKLEDILKTNDNFEQGYYLVEERDLCGNIERYIVYLDTEVPTLIADTETGDGGRAEISYEPSYVERHKGIMLYMSFNVKSFVDIDECAFIIINGRGMDNVRYLIGDEIPSLCFANGYWGVYTISVYDRSRNILTFDIKIAGEAPTLSHTSLTNETRCRFTITCSDTSNAITKIEFYKVTYDNDYIKMTNDDDGTVISAETLTYVLRTGGKYVVKYEDIYGRLIESEPLFYMKGLPSGVLSGVKENGITNKDVKFDYASNCSIILYTWKNSQWIVSNEYMTIEEKEGYNIASISASVITSNMYKYFLYVTDDQNLFVEYRFEIDCICPQVEARTQDESLEFDTITSKPFFVTWEESNLTAYYYNKNSSLGELGQAKYTKDTYISVAGTYVFSIYDSVKNLTSFTIILDNAVSYNLDGKYTLLDDGSYISKNYITLTVNERTAEWKCVSSNDFIPANGQRIDVDGTYTFHIVDLYQNVLDITIIIDNLPPTARIESVSGEVIEGREINEFFKLICEEDNVTITFSNNGLSFVAYEGQVIEKEGNYTFKLVDRMNNIQSVSIKLDLTVSYSINGTYIKIDERYVSKNWVSVTVDEAYTVFDVKNDDGLTVKSGEKINIEGIYVITICDNAGNTAEIVIEIDKTAPTVTILTADGQAVEKNSKISSAFRVICDEEGSSVFIAKKDLNYAVYDKAIRTEQGVYNFRITDRIGNEDIFSVEIDRSVEYSVRGVYVQTDKNTYVSKNLLVIEIKEKYKNFIVTSDNGHTFMPGDKVELEGKYTMQFEDIQGNAIEVVFIIDKTAPTIHIEGVEPNNTTNNDVKITVEDSTSNYYTKGGESGRIAFDGEITIIASGNYTVVSTDIVGNETVLTFGIDKEVSVTAAPNIINGQIISESISFKFDEIMTSITLVKDGVELQYSAGNISEPGYYVLTVEDNVGNIQKWSWTILANIAQSYKITLPDDYKVSVLLDGNVISDVVENGEICLKKNGVYMLYFENDHDDALNYSLSITLDNVAPKVDIEIGKSSVVISNPNKENLSFELYRDNKKIDYSLGNTLTAVGKYKLVITDEIGNCVEYEFELDYINASGIMVIVVVLLVVILAIVLIIRSRRNQRIK